jgi:ketosteroid isomerase-like protein
MRRIPILMALALALAGNSFSQTKKEPVSPRRSKDEQAVLQTLHQWVDALQRNDTAAVERIVADDYLNTTAEGSVLNKEQDTASLKSGDVKFESAATEDVKVRLFGKTAVVTGIGRFKGTYKGRPFTVNERFTDVYVKRHDRWQPVAAHSTALQRAN